MSLYLLVKSLHGICKQLYHLMFEIRIIFTSVNFLSYHNSRTRLLNYKFNSIHVFTFNNIELKAEIESPLNITFRDRFQENPLIPITLAMWNHESNITIDIESRITGEKCFKCKCGTTY